MFTNYIEVDIDKIIKNINNIKKSIDDSPICAVIKANAYGLGAVPIANYIEEYVSYFAVASFNEAKVLRASNIKKPILILGYVNPEEAILSSKYNIEIPIYDLAYAKQINDKLDSKLDVHIALDTGHGRLGFRPFEFEDILKLKDLQNLHIKGAFSHFSTADEEDIEFTQRQNKIFNGFKKDLGREFDIENFHIANSAATIFHNIKGDMQRIGISLYGIYPSEYLLERKDVELSKAFSIKSAVSFVKNIEKGTSLSYGRSFIADKDMKIATISIGYADGFFRAFSNKGEVLINGKIARVCGRVCMDQIMVDVSNIDVNIGDEVEIYPDLYKEANKIGTIPYELMTALSLRVIRVYKKDGKVVKIENYLGEIYED